MESDIIDEYLPLLRKFENDEGLEITHAEEEPGAKVGENYMSVVTRTKIRGRRGNGTPYFKSFMRKELLPDPEMIEVSRGRDLFQNEAHYYNKVLPLLGPFGPECVLAEPQRIIMEDLKLRNFVICERRKMLDIGHCMAFLDTLATMHASSLYLKLHEPEDFKALIKPLKEVAFPADSQPSIGQYIVSGISYAIRSLETINPKTENLKKGIEFFKSYQDIAYSEMQKMSLPREDRYQVLGHGDSWNNNILFLHDADGKVLRVKLVDFQVVRLTSPATDILYFLYSSAKPEVICEHFDEIVKAYYDVFIHTLRQMNLSKEDLDALPLSWLQNDMKRFGVVGMFMSLLVLHAVFTEENQAVPVDMDKNDFVKKDGSTNKSLDVMPLSDEKTERIRLIIEHFMKLI